MSAISINGVQIAEDAILAEMQHHPAPAAETAIQGAAHALAVRELLLQEARRQGFDANPEGDELPEEAAIRRLIEREIKTPSADEATCRRYYENNRNRFRSPDAFDAQHILYVAPEDDATARDAARSRARDALSRILTDPSRFETIAQAESSCPSRVQGGRLGPIQRGSADEVFETFLMSLRDGETCPVPVETKYGVHIVRLVRKIAGRDLPFDAVKRGIAAYLEDSAWRRAVHQYILILAGRAKIEGLELGGAGSPLVQ